MQEFQKPHDTLTLSQDQFCIVLFLKIHDKSLKNEEDNEDIQNRDLKKIKL